MTAPVESAWWPGTIGRLVLTGSIARMYASYVDDLTGREYRAGCEQGGRYRRGWWVLAVDEGTRSGGYRDFSPVNQEAAIRRLRSLASASVGTGEWATVSVEPGEQVALDAWEVSG